MFDVITAAAVKLEEPRKFSPSQEARGASCVWRRNCNISNFSAHTRQKCDLKKQPPEKRPAQGARFFVKRCPVLSPPLAFHSHFA
jgi:hypothetical protein